jgi:hypothetical protein
MESEDLFSCSQGLTTSLYPEPHEYSLYFLPRILKIHFSVILFY